MAPAFQAIHLPVAAVWLVGLAVRWTLFFRPDMKGLRFAVDIGSNVVTMLVAAYLLRADAIVMQAPGVVAGPGNARLPELVHGIDVAVRVSVVVMVVVAAWEIGRAVWKRRQS